jgi:hypothetical protein
MTTIDKLRLQAFGYGVLMVVGFSMVALIFGLDTLRWLGH